MATLQVVKFGVSSCVHHFHISFVHIHWIINSAEAYIHHIRVFIQFPLEGCRVRSIELLVIQFLWKHRRLIEALEFLHVFHRVV